MAETPPGADAEQRLEQDAADMDERLHKLEDHIDEAQTKAADRRREADPASEVAGDWEDTEPDSVIGEDPSAFDDPETDADDDLGDDPENEDL
jgi:hypothetical protein